jgi:cell division protein ZapA (FtsZ GTPase activity inhibitor)
MGRWNFMQRDHAQDDLPGKGRPKIAELAVGGVKVKVRTDVTPTALKQIREFVDSRCADFEGKSERELPRAQLLALVALNLAEELFEEKERSKAFRRQVQERSERLLNRVEAHLNRSL